MASQLESSFWSTIDDTARTLSVHQATALILLQSYEWNSSALAADYNKWRQLHLFLSRCPAPMPPNNSLQECACCRLNLLCDHYNCGHVVCQNCISVSVVEQLSRGRFLLCPAPGCGQFINHHNLPIAIRQSFIHNALQDFIDKTVDRRSPIAKCLAVIWSQKMKIAGIAAAVLVGLILYKANRWQTNHPFKAFFLRLFVSFLRR